MTRLFIPDTRGLFVDIDENPLKTRIRLDDYGRLRLRLGMLEDALESANAVIKLARQEPDAKWLEAPMPDAAGVLAFFTHMERALLDVHAGDCTCVPASCLKCHAEGMLGISTIPGLGKYEGHAIQMAFGQLPAGATRADAVHWLRTAPIVGTWDGWEAHASRWRRERVNAASWLESLDHALVNAS